MSVIITIITIIIIIISLLLLYFKFKNVKSYNLSGGYENSDSKDISPGHLITYDEIQKIRSVYNFRYYEQIPIDPDKTYMIISIIDKAKIIDIISYEGFEYVYIDQNFKPKDLIKINDIHDEPFEGSVKVMKPNNIKQYEGYYMLSTLNLIGEFRIEDYSIGIEEVKNTGIKLGKLLGKGFNQIVYDVKNINKSERIKNIDNSETVVKIFNNYKKNTQIYLPDNLQDHLVKIIDRGERYIICEKLYPITNVNINDYKKFIINIIRKLQNENLYYYDCGMWQNMQRKNGKFVVSDVEFVTAESIIKYIDEPYFIYVDHEIVSIFKDYKDELIKLFMNSIMLFEIMCLEISNGDLRIYSTIRNGKYYEKCKMLYDSKDIGNNIFGTIKPITLTNLLKYYYLCDIDLSSPEVSTINHVNEICENIINEHI